MGSRVMHYIVATRVASKLPHLNNIQFILGNLAPDFVLDKEDSHYYIGDTSQYTRTIDFDAYLTEHFDREFNDFNMGFYAHLITDQMWLNGIYLPWLRNLVKSSEIHKAKYHDDFRRLNTLLLDYYDLNDEYRGFVDLIEEIDFPNDYLYASMRDVKTSIESDFMITSENELQYFTMNLIIGYIETCAEKCVDYIKNYESGKPIHKK